MSGRGGSRGHRGVPRDAIRGHRALSGAAKTFAQALMSAEADAICGAAYGQRSDERVNSRNGCRAREWDTRPARSTHRSGGMFVLVEDAAEPITSAYVEMGDLVWIGDRRG
ncbi:Transposase, Mutator family [Micromonospora inositola]|uniref:Transposase, Mutator family n=1 Tax=Micromonospora inositola TaxID=47865 RepID=A0A1C5K431_9ACTN|nr:Transposase, Mutator family [Micromonospora inositola]